ncbi:hypothetical protein AB0F44_25710 [Nocardioides sp. NPDC023903]|uniref:hypothetical protein n=1 Tax=Nocardioides sp. NPDC023903 TaxID=3157195 RepID=UPI0033F3D6FE
MSSALVIAVISAVAGPILVGLLVRYLDQYTGPAALRRRILEDYALLEKLPEDDEARPFLEGIIDAHVWRYAYTHYVHRARGQIRPAVATIGTVVASIGILGGGTLVFQAKAPEVDPTSPAAIEESVRRIDQWSDYFLVFLVVVIGATIGFVMLIWWAYLHYLWNPSLPLDLPDSLKPAVAPEDPGGGDSSPAAPGSDVPSE